MSATDKRTDLPLGPNGPNGFNGPTRKSSYLPIVIYVILAIILLLVLMSMRLSGSRMLIVIVLVVLWGLLTWWLCKKGYIGWAWMVVFGPLIIWGFFCLLAVAALSD